MSQFVIPPAQIVALLRELLRHEGEWLVAPLAMFGAQVSMLVFAFDRTAAAILFVAVATAGVLMSLLRAAVNKRAAPLTILPRYTEIGWKTTEHPDEGVRAA